MKELSTTFAVLIWLAGVVLAHGFWQTTISALFPPYAWYLVVEFAMKAFGLVT